MTRNCLHFDEKYQVSASNRSVTILEARCSNAILLHSKKCISEYAGLEKSFILLALAKNAFF